MPDKLHRVNANIVTFHCLGCGCAHNVPVSHGPDYPAGPLWGWNGSMELPTLTPSIKVTSGHYIEGRQNPNCWCTYAKEHPEDLNPFVCLICHSFVTEGKIQYLGDSTHKLSGQTVEIPNWEF